MRPPSWRRRQLLLYFGFGLVGTVATPAFGLGSKTHRVLTTNLELNRFPMDRPVTLTAAATGDKLPDFQGIDQWLNSEPLAIATLKGNVVLVQFWTFSCINCQRTLPYLTRWHQQYAAAGLKIIGVHSPEFAFEREVNNVKRALKQYQIAYPVPLDNEFKTWRAYNNRYWPHLFLGDRQGILRYHHIGEGAYAKTEQKIRQLLG